MQEKDGLFLSTQEAVQAVNIALSRYSSQFNLIANVWPLVFGRDAYVIRDSTPRLFWVKTSSRSKLVSADEDDLKRLMMERLKRSPPSLSKLATICRQVFGTPTHHVSDPSAAEKPAGIWIKTDMADFQCIRCGQCCQTLNYHDGCSLEDYRRWQELGRDDILAWVGTVRQNEVVITCRIWIEPGTNHYAEVCPWLKQIDQSGRTLCTIHTVRPTVCRQYPGTRKHARLTGCQGV